MKRGVFREKEYPPTTQHTMCLNQRGFREREGDYASHLAMQAIFSKKFRALTRRENSPLASVMTALRTEWIESLRKTARLVFSALAADQWRAAMPVEGRNAGERRASSHLEAIGRSLAGGDGPRAFFHYPLTFDLHPLISSIRGQNDC